MPNTGIMRQILVLLFLCFQLLANGQPFTIVLGRPTDQSVSANIVFQSNMDYFLEYGENEFSLIHKIPVKRATSGIPELIELNDLPANQYTYYRIQYKSITATNFQSSELYRFHTQRSKDDDFVFAIEADEHLYDKKGIPSLYQITLNNIGLDKPDFLLSLGDTFGDDHTPDETTSQDMQALHRDYLQYLSKLTHSIPFFFCLGNHEGENGYYLNQNAPENIAVYGTLWRKYYYPNPFPNAFYSGNTMEEEYGIGLPENYYAYTWGNALFVVLDVYRDCTINEKPKNWDWTLGEKQYRWFKSTLENSNAKFKFVFAHHTRGQGRGGVSTARGFEWGGYDNNKYLFDEMRPGWGKPIHDLMVNNNVSVFFQGHDHLFALDELDGVYYQTVPMPSDTTYSIGVTDNGDAYDGVKLDGSGHLKVSVSKDCATIDYIQAYLPKDTLSGSHKNRNLAYSYSIGDCQTSLTSEIENDQSVSAFPNPANDEITINMGLTGDQNPRSITLFDCFGRAIVVKDFHAKSNYLTFSTENFPNGIYGLKLSLASGKDLFTKICIQHF